MCLKRRFIGVRGSLFGLMMKAKGLSWFYLKARLSSSPVLKVFPLSFRKRKFKISISSDRSFGGRMSFSESIWSKPGVPEVNGQQSISRS